MMKIKIHGDLYLCLACWGHFGLCTFCCKTLMTGRYANLLSSKIDNLIRTQVVSNSDAAISKAVVLMFIKNCLLFHPMPFSWSLLGFLL